MESNEDFMVVIMEAKKANQAIDARVPNSISFVGFDIPYQGAENFVDAYTHLLTNRSVLVDHRINMMIQEYLPSRDLGISILTVETKYKSDIYKLTI